MDFDTLVGVCRYAGSLSVRWVRIKQSSGIGAAVAEDEREIMDELHRGREIDEREAQWELWNENEKKTTTSSRTE